MYLNPGGFTHSESWSPLPRDHAEINARLREEDGARYTPLAEIVNLAGADLPLYRLQ